jgi:hypothetical protein
VRRHSGQPSGTDRPDRQTDVLSDPVVGSVAAGELELSLTQRTPVHKHQDSPEYEPPPPQRNLTLLILNVLGGWDRRTRSAPIHDGAAVAVGQVAMVGPRGGA